MKAEPVRFYPKKSLRRTTVKKAVIFALLAVITVVFVTTGCGGSPAPAPAQQAPAPKQEPPKAQPIVKKPDMLDHKNYKWGTQPPEWVTMNVSDLEAMDKFKTAYVFKFESPRAKDLQGAELWTKNFTAAAEIAQQVKNRVQVKFAGAAAGDINKLGTYFEQVVKSFSDATFAGYKLTDSYWVQMRYYKPDGNPDSDDYTYLALYSIPRATLDELVRKALDNAAAVDKPKTEEEKTARNRVTEEMKKGL